MRLYGGRLIGAGVGRKADLSLMGYLTLEKDKTNLRFARINEHLELEYRL